MIGQFWGTSAAEGIPAPFCSCPVCENARHVGGKELRTRSAFRVSKKMMIDLGADVVTQSMKYGSLSELEYVLITHTHEDHINIHMMMQAYWAKMTDPEHYKKLHFYLTDSAFDIVNKCRETSWVIKGFLPKIEDMDCVEFHRLEYGKRVEIDGIGVTAFRGNHVGNMEENSALYLLELPDGRNLFYGLDSGRYFDETLEALKNHHIDIFVAETAAGAQKIEPTMHGTIYMVRDLVDTLIEQGTLGADSKLYISHINHCTSHQTMLETAEKLAFPIETTIAYDGLKIL